MKYLGSLSALLRNVSCGSSNGCLTDKAMSCEGERARPPNPDLTPKVTARNCSSTGLCQARILWSSQPCIPGMSAASAAQPCRHSPGDPTLRKKNCLSILHPAGLNRKGAALASGALGCGDVGAFLRQGNGDNQGWSHLGTSLPFPQPWAVP